MNRPQGITILAWVAIVGGGLLVLASIGGVFASLAVFALVSLAGPAGFLAGLEALVASVVSILIGALSIWFGIGALSLKPSAWNLGVLLAYIDGAWAIVNLVLVLVTHPAGIIGAVISAAISIAITLVLLWYLFTDEVKAAFGKSAEQPISFLAPVLQQIDGMFGNRGGGRPAPPQGTGGYPPPGDPGGYQAPAPPQPPTAPTPPANYNPPQPPQPPTP